MTPLVVVSYIINVVCVVGAVAIPSDTWVQADRNRSFWLTFLVILGLLGPFGLIADVAFLLGALPKLVSGGGSGRTANDEFRKQR